ncbi:MAG: hypothetical protein M1495_10605 [Bacteroidetes bacterium]|nr:hypothetical protein [Bacteroidota bacterium]
MKLTKLVSLVLTGAVLFALSGCKKDSVTNPFDNISTTENAPTFSNNTNSFAFSVTGNNFTKNYEYIIKMNSQTLGIALTITNRSRGNVIMSLFDDTNSKVFTRDLSTNTALSETFNFEANVNRIQIQFTNFTASFKCAITAQ